MVKSTSLCWTDLGSNFVCVISVILIVFLFYQNIVNAEAWFKVVWMCELIGIMWWSVGACLMGWKDVGLNFS